MKRRDRLPRVAALLLAATALHLVGLVGIGAGFDPFVASLLARPASVKALGIALPILDGTLALLAVATLVTTLRVVRGVPGRARVIALAIASAVHFPAMAATWFLAMRAARRALDSGLSSVLSPVDVFVGIDPNLALGIQAALAVVAVTTLVMAIAAIACWFLLEERTRTRLFVVFDLALLAALVVATIRFPIRPTESGASLLGPTLRLAVTSLFALRASLRLLPRFLDAIELVNVRWMVASRHLRAKKSNFLAAIGTLSILAVAVSSCMLTVVLSVMGGFRHDLKQKILGNSAHVVVDREFGSFEGWGATLAAVGSTQGVVAATPYADGEVMVTSSSNLSGAILRGIDPGSISAVTDLRRNLVQGSLDSLVHPEALLDAEPQGIPGLQRTHEGPREVLPGIIIGRELARTLRLYVGDELEVISPFGELGPTGRVPKTRSFRIAGIFFSGMYEYDMKLAYVLLPVAQRFLGLGDAISGIEVRVRDVEQAPDAAGRIERRIHRSDLRVEAWQEKNKNLFGALALEKLVMFALLGIAVVIAGFCVFGTLTLMVQEKTKEVGILKAMGATDRVIVLIFLFEGFLIGLFGAMLGLGLGFVASFAAEHIGIRINPEIFYMDRLPVHVDATEFAIVGVSAIVVCLLSTVFPAFLASGTRPVDALRYD